MEKLDAIMDELDEILQEEFYDPGATGPDRTTLDDTVRARNRIIKALEKIGAERYWSARPKVTSFQDAVDWLKADPKNSIWYPIFDDPDGDYTSDECLESFLERIEDEEAFQDYEETMYKETEEGGEVAPLGDEEKVGGS